MTHRDAFGFYLWTAKPMTSEVWGFFTLTAVFAVVSHNMWKSPINKVRNHLVLLSIKNRHFPFRPKDRLLRYTHDWHKNLQNVVKSFRLLTGCSGILGPVTVMWWAFRTKKIFTVKVWQSLIWFSMNITKYGKQELRTV